MKEKLYSPILCDYMADTGGLEDRVHHEVSQEEAMRYLGEIHTAIVGERLPEDAERGQMSYYYGGGSVGEKVRSLDFDVEVHGGKLWGVAVLDISEPLTPAELDTIRGFIKDQYAYGFGEGFEQICIKVDGGELNVHLWPFGGSDDFFLDTQREFAERLGISMSPDITFEPAIMSTSHIAPAADNDDARDTLLAQIAKKYCRVPTLETRKSDSLDFHEVSVWGLKEALEDAYSAGIAYQMAHSKEANRMGAAGITLPDPTGTGYLFAVTDNSDFYIPNILHVQRDDSLFIFPNDEAAARAAEKQGVRLIYGMPDVPDGVYLDTPENRAAIADYFERERLAMPASEELTQRLHARLDANYHDYRDSVLRLNSSEIFAEAAEIAAVCASYEFFKDRHTVTTGQAELLLKYADPLDLISDCWIYSPIAEAEDIINILTERVQMHPHLYELSQEGVAPPSSVGGNGERASVVERIRQHAKEARDRLNPPKEKPARNTSEPER